MMLYKLMIVGLRFRQLLNEYAPFGAFSFKGADKDAYESWIWTHLIFWQKKYLRQEFTSFVSKKGIS